MTIKLILGLVIVLLIDFLPLAKYYASSRSIDIYLDGKVESRH